MSKFQVINPYDNSVYGEFDFHDKSYVQKVMSKLKKGKAIQASLTGYERSLILNKLADLFEKHAEEVGQIITNEMGKTISDSIVEMQRSANTARASADECRQMVGEVIDADAYPPKRGKIGIVRRKPLGIVLAITPFNFPVNLSMHKIGPAFAAGNTIFFKPGPQNYFSGKKISRTLL
jgi:acyl-CoA reductase-like NAD-dependent aldehyde dehydrogenase